MAANNSIARYLALVEQLYLDIADGYIDGHNAQRDIEEIRDRVQHEGWGFLTKTLPLYGKRLDQALVGKPFDCSGLITRDGLPKFCYELWERVLVMHCQYTFAERGVTETLTLVREDADSEAIRRLRQLMYFYYKLDLPYDQETSQAVIDGFVQVDNSLTWDVHDTTNLRIAKIAQEFTCDVFGCFDHRDIRPAHGPGAVATGERSHEKHRFSRIYKHLESEYPFTGYFVSGVNHLSDEPDYIAGLEEVPEACAKVTLVPKDSRGPRLISMEPLEIQWIQQGLMRTIVPHLEKHKLTRGHVNFTDQSINGRLALLGSKDQQWATLDMKEASDRVSITLVMALFENCPLLDGLMAARSTKTLLPNGTEIRLRKFAPMGSAVCFPIEAFVFYALCVSVLMHVLRISRRKARQSLYVYGDDIIVRTEYAPVLMQYLPRFGLLLNETKCCTTGFFRESCGVEAYRGVEITPLRMRKTVLSPGRKDRLNVSTITSGIMLSNALHARGHFRAAEFIRRSVEALTGPLPIVDDSTPQSFLCWVRPEAANTGLKGFRIRLNNDYQNLEIWAWRVVTPVSRVATDSWRSILIWFSRPNSETPTDVYANPSRQRLKRGWCSLK